MVQRQNYIDNLIALKDKHIIKVISGVRRCGKSTIFDLYIDYLLQNGIHKEQIIYINLEDLGNDSLLDYSNLYNYIEDKLIDGASNYIFIDEIQKCRFFEKAVDSLFLKSNCDIYITGSNAFLLSGELATLLSGRYIQLNMLPFSFKEYFIANKGNASNKEVLFQDYIRFGSLPYVSYLDNNEKIIQQYIDSVYNTIIVKDVATREHINDITVLESILKAIASSVGSYISVKKISDTLISSGRKISQHTVERYLRALTDSYIIYKVDRYDIKGRQYLKTLSKYYFVDTGIRNYILSQSSSDIGHIIENIVYLELIKRYNKVNIGKFADKEVDFVASGVNGIEYFQVSASVLAENTLTRELSPLSSINDNFNKYLLTLDTIGSNANHNGIKQLNLIDWLLNE